MKSVSLYNAEGLEYLELWFASEAFWMFQSDVDAVVESRKKTSYGLCVGVFLEFLANQQCVLETFAFLVIN